MPYDQEKTVDLKERVRSFQREMKNGNSTSPKGSCELAIQTINLLIRIVSQAKFSNASELLKHVRAEGQQIQSSDPSENIISNMILRTLKIIREEYREILHPTEGQLSTNLHNLSLAEGEEDYTKPTPNLKALVIDALNELKTEIEGCVENIAALAPSYINDFDVILTIGMSRTVEAFLKAAANKKINFKVLVSECAPFYHGHEMAKKLSQAKISTTLISECQIGTVMHKVTKVIIGTHSFMANGGLKAVSGSNIMAVIAREQNKPVIVCSSLYKLSPFFHGKPNHASFNKFASPSELLDYDDAELLSKVEVIAPVFDYVPPDLVSLVVSNNGAQSITYVYRLVNDFYHPDDNEL